MLGLDDGMVPGKSLSTEDMAALDIKLGALRKSLGMEDVTAVKGRGNDAKVK